MPEKPKRSPYTSDSEESRLFYVDKQGDLSVEVEDKLLDSFLYKNIIYFSGPETKDEAGDFGAAGESDSEESVIFLLEKEETPIQKLKPSRTGSERTRKRRDQQKRANKRKRAAAEAAGTPIQEPKPSGTGSKKTLTRRDQQKRADERKRAAAEAAWSGQVDNLSSSMGNMGVVSSESEESTVRWGRYWHFPSQK